MIVYRDIISGDEVLSDAFILKEVIDADGNKVRRLGVFVHFKVTLICFYCILDRRINVLRIQEHHQE